jgi:hypothetical protein
MNGYNALLFLHVTSIVVWLGAGTTLALIGLYGRRSGDSAILERLPRIGEWLGPRVFGPAALGALAFGLSLDADGHWGFPLWIALGVGAYAASFALNVGVRVPLTRRAPHDPGAARLLARLPFLELAVLYLAVADMVFKP